MARTATARRREAELETERAEAALSPDEALAAYNFRFILCRLGHAWQLQNDPTDNNWGTYMIWRCATCSMEKEEVWNSHGHVTERRYYAPDGYALSGMDYDFKRDDFRQEFVRRTQGEKALPMGPRPRRRRR